MSHLVQCDFSSGRKTDGASVDLIETIGQLREAQLRLMDHSVDSILDTIDNFARRLTDRDLEIHVRFPGSGLAFIAGWCRRNNLEQFLDDAFGTKAKLDRFVASQAREKRAYKAFPRGLVIHWMAGNVPTLSFLSLIFGILTKNANIIKLASGSDQLLASLIELMTSGDNAAAKAIAESIAVIRFPHEQKTIGATLSKESDTRVMWGSDESIAEIMKLPRRPQTNDVVFPSKISMLAMTNGALRNPDNFTTVAKRIARDMSIFEQKACASPHTLFIETTDQTVVDGFAETLAEALKGALRTMPKTRPSEREVSTILNLRARYDIMHKAWYSAGTEFTVLTDDEFQLGPAVGNRTIYVRKVENLERLAEIITPKVQSVGLLAAPSEYDRITEVLGKVGVQRITDIGVMTHFESPWDGVFIPQQLVRWTSRSNNI